MTRNIKVKYFAMLREITQLEEEIITVEGEETPSSLYLTLKERYGFSLDLSRVCFVVNEEYASKDLKLQADDEVVFIPPVSGG